MLSCLRVYMQVDPAEIHRLSRDLEEARAELRRLSTHVESPRPDPLTDASSDIEVWTGSTFTLPMLLLSAVLAPSLYLVYTMFKLKVRACVTLLWCVSKRAFCA